MRTIIFTADIDGYTKGQIASVQNNEAHRYIDRGLAEIAKATEYVDRMIPGRSYKGKIEKK